MTQKKRLTTIVPHVENLELRKDTGQIPYHFHRNMGYDATLLTYFYTLSEGRRAGAVKVPPTDKIVIARNYPFLQSEVPGLKMAFLKDLGRTRFFEKAIYRYLRNEARQIDILNLFHFNTENIFYGLLYKLLNPKGKLYLKLDIDLPYYRSRTHFFNTRTRFSKLKKTLMERVVYPLFFFSTQVISAESAAGLAYFRTRFPGSASKLRIVQNGVDAERINSYTAAKPFSEKENLLISVGRIGTAQKNNGLLLRAIAALPSGDWKFCFIGEVQPAFQDEIKDFYLANPHMKERVIFTGKIDDPAMLYEYYNKAKIFCLTSRNEGFPLAACEAAFFGNYLILADTIDCFPELTNSGRFGTAVNLDEDALTNIISDCISDVMRLEKLSDEMKEYAKAHLCWQAIVPSLARSLTL